MAQALGLTRPLDSALCLEASHSWSGFSPKPTSPRYSNWQSCSLPHKALLPWERISKVVLFSHLSNLCQSLPSLPLAASPLYLTSIRCLLLLSFLNTGGPSPNQNPNQPVTPLPALPLCSPPGLGIRSSHVLKNLSLTFRRASSCFIYLFMRNGVPIRAHPYSTMLCSHFKWGRGKFNEVEKRSQQHTLQNNVATKPRTGHSHFCKEDSCESTRPWLRVYASKCSKWTSGHLSRVMIANDILFVLFYIFNWFYNDKILLL